MPSIYAVVEDSTGLVVNVILWDGESEYSAGDGYSLIQSDEAVIGGTYAGGVFTAPPPPVLPAPTQAEIEEANTAQLQQLNQITQAQKTALTNRVATLQDAIELEMATPDEVAELPVRKGQLTEWKKYAVYLGRVTTQDGWALTVDWPVQPAAGMDLSTSAAIAPSVQTS